MSDHASDDPSEWRKKGKKEIREQKTFAMVIFLFFMGS